MRNYGMKKQNILVTLLFTTLLAAEEVPAAQQEKVQEPAPEVLTPSEPTTPAIRVPNLTSPESIVNKATGTKRKRREKRVSFNFKDESLVTILNKFASQKGINIILPQGANAINQQITFKLDKKIPLSEAENYLYTFLDLAGYTMFPNGNFYIVQKTDPNTIRNPFPLYINVKPQDLPNNDDRIRAIFYLSNMKVPNDTTGQDPLTAILKDMLSVNTSFLYDPKSNGIIITDKSNRIASVMNVILELDTANTRDVLEEVPLFNSSATTLAALIKNQLLAISNNTPSLLRSDTKTEPSLYFSTNISVVADTRTNKLYLIGRQSAVTRLRDFIREYLDADPDSGRSILHVYDLQYLDAETFATTLQNIVATPPGSSDGGDQSTSSASGPERYFDSVQIVAETLQQAPAAQQVATGTPPPAENNTGPSPASLNGTFTGGNRLVVAAKHSDWKKIKQLIAELDKPQPQVIIEVLIVDLTFQDQKLLAAQTRNPSSLHLPQGVEFQAAHITSPITNATQNSDGSGNNNNATTIAGDLLRLFGNNQSIATPLTTAPARGAGALIVSFNDLCGQSGIWGLLEILQEYSETRVLSHPYLVTLNNFQAQESLSQIKRLRGEQSVGEGAVSSLRQVDVPATLNISVVPRVASDKRLNLQISISIDQFLTQDPNDGTRVTRNIQTTANLSSGQVLILGGLTRITNNESGTETPLLAQIPIIGQLFKSRGLNLQKTNLAVFISPTIVNPKLRGGQARYTADKVNNAYADLNEGQIFDTLRDPITRWFFMDGRDNHKAILTQYTQDAAPNPFIPTTIPPDVQEEAEMVEIHKLKKLIAEEKQAQKD